MLWRLAAPTPMLPRGSATRRPSSSWRQAHGTNDVLRSASALEKPIWPWWSRNGAGIGQVNITGAKNKLRKSRSYPLRLGCNIVQGALSGLPCQWTGTPTKPGGVVAHQGIRTELADWAGADRQPQPCEPPGVVPAPTNSSVSGTASSLAVQARQVSRPASGDLAPSWLTPHTAQSAMARRLAWLAPGAGPGQ